jgi:hypothetical protein
MIKTNNSRGYVAVIIDIHTHIWGTHSESDKTNLLAAMNRYHLDRIYVSGLQSKISDRAEIARLNSLVYEFMQQELERVGGAYTYYYDRNYNAEKASGRYFRRNSVTTLVTEADGNTCLEMKSDVVGDQWQAFTTGDVVAFSFRVRLKDADASVASQLKLRSASGADFAYFAGKNLVIDSGEEGVPVCNTTGNKL